MFRCAAVYVAALLIPLGPLLATEQSAQHLLQTGRYEEALDVFESFQVSQPGVALLGMVRCLDATGKQEKADEQLQQYLAAGKNADAAVHAEFGRRHFERGKYAAAREQIAVAIDIDENNLGARLVRAELFRIAGQIEEANAAYAGIANLGESPDPYASLARARATVQHARWNRNSDVFDELVNTTYPEIVRKHETFWQAHVESARLFLEKYNPSDAAKELNAAIKINPRATEAYVEFGRLALMGYELERAESAANRALATNPNSTSALQLKADIAFRYLDAASAIEPLEKARQINPLDEGTLGRFVAVYVRLDGRESLHQPTSRASSILAQARQRNAHCGRLMEAAARSFDMLRLYPLSLEFYQQAIAALPQLVSARGELGLVQMRLGMEVEAYQTLEEAFEIDPFNVRVKNTLEVLDLLQDYAVIETDHFIIKFNRAHDEQLAVYASRFLEEEVFPDLVKALDYVPPDKTLLEIFSKGQGVSGHGWFSARMVGLPFIGTVGACAGKMFALRSPAEGQPFNWARVLRHEFVHVINLQQTDFLIPHWFTEALAVRNENGRYPAAWDQILAKYEALDKLFDLSTINLGFVRMGESERWTLAYYQAYLYADFIIQLGGDDSLARMLKAYAAGKSTEESLRSVLGKELVDFEAEYRRFLRRQVKNRFQEPARSLEDIKRELAKRAQDPRLLAELSFAYFAVGEKRQARNVAEQSLQLSRDEPIARLTLAKLLFSIGEDDNAWEHLEMGLDRESPNALVLAAAADWKMRLGDLDEARELYQLGRAKFPADFAWTKHLARILLLQKDDSQLAPILAEIADREVDQIPIARKLVQLAVQRHDYAAAEKWANRILHINVMDPRAHAELAEALAGQDRKQEAIREFNTALKLFPGETTWQARLTELEKETK